MIRKELLPEIGTKNNYSSKNVKWKVLYNETQQDVLQMLQKKIKFLRRRRKDVYFLLNSA